MLCKNRGIYGFLGPSWVLITFSPGSINSTWRGECPEDQCSAVGEIQ